MKPLALIGYPQAGARWALVPESEWPETLPCLECNGTGEREGFRDCWQASTESHYTEDETYECEECLGGRVSLMNARDSLMAEHGLRWDDDGNLWRST